MKRILLCLACCFAFLFSIQAQTLYDITYNGGNDGVGTLIKFTPATNNLTVVKSFENPGKWPQYTTLVQASNGKLYGMTSRGGYDGIGGIGYGGGAIFSFDPSTSTYTKLKNFDGTNGANPYGSLVQASDGKLYGMTSLGGINNRGVIFSFDPSSSIYTKLKDFNIADGANPYGSLIQATDGKLYGMTYSGGSSGGVIFSFDPSTSTYTKLKDFDGTNGWGPYGSLMQASNGKLYGMTTYGGSNDGGVIFSFDPSSSTYTKLRDLDGTYGVGTHGDLIQTNDGKLYGMTTGGGAYNYYGVIFSFDPSSSTYTKLRDFDGTNAAKPYGSLMQASNGKLYGMTSGGGSNDYGVIFSFDPSSSTYTKLKDFDGADGGVPGGSLVQASNGKLYGLTTRGGAGGGNSVGFGVIFSFDPLSSTYTKLRDFEVQNGRYPSNLLLASDGKFYGTTSIMNALSGDDAVLFSFDPSSSNYTKLMDFDSANTFSPYGKLIQASDGKLYGMSTVIFSFEPSSSTYTKLKDYDNTNSGYSYGSLVQASDGKLYGMTNDGGINNQGVIFSFDPSSSTYTKLVDFDNTNGANPYGSLMQASNGKLYGMTAKGGSNGGGVIFSFDLFTSTYTKLVDFNGTNGVNPYGSLIQANDGKLYGMTSLNIFSFDPSSSIYTKLEDFPFINGAYPDGFAPLGNLMQASDGKLYGMTFIGGENDAGVVFSFDPSSSTYTKLKDFDSTYGAYAYRYFIGSAFIEIRGNVVTAVNDITNSLHEIKVFPNPASDIVSISFFLDKPEKVSMKIFDINGRKVKGLIEKTFQRGENRVQWNTSGIQAGIYFLKIDAGAYSAAKKLSVIK